MSGHSHWAGIKHHKGINDAKRAALFTKVGKNIILAAERGGGNPDTNYLLKIAIAGARAVNMPKDRIEHAIKRGTGELVGEKIEAITYEGFGPGNVAMLIETTTDNKNRTVSELRSLFTKGGGKLGASGSVAFLFERVGILAFSQGEQVSLEELAIESGAKDYRMTKEVFIVYTEIADLQTVQQTFEKNGKAPEQSLLGWRALQTTSLAGEIGAAYAAFREGIEDHPDVSAVWDTIER